VWISPAVASSLSGLPPCEIREMINMGAICIEHFNGRLYVNLNEVDALSTNRGSGGAE
jgi:hypothetical protein